MYPFNIESLSLELEEAVRILPGKRHVCRAKFKGEAAYVKFYYGKGSDRYFKREKEGLDLLASNGFAGPAILDSGCVLSSELPSDWNLNSGSHYIVCKAIVGKSVAEVWEEGDQADLMMRLIQVLAKYHKAGVIQTDLHFGNFIIAEDETIYCLDGDGIKSSKSGNKLLENLALLCAQAGFYCPLSEEEILQIYGSEVDAEKFHRLLGDVRNNRIEKLASKVQRNCTAVSCKRRKSDIIYINKKYDSEALQRLLNNPDKPLDEGHAELLKGGNTCTVYKIKLGEQELVVKRYNPRKGLKGKMDVLRAGRSRTCWSHSFAMRDNFLTTPEAVALLVRKEGIQRRDWLISIAAKGELLSEYVNSVERAENMLSEIQGLFNAMKQGRFSHGDCKATNFIVGPDEKLQVIDLDSSIFHKCDSSFGKAYKKDKSRFLRNWPDDIRELFTEKLSF